jgi:hypothetical protein
MIVAHIAERSIAVTIMEALREPVHTAAALALADRAGSQEVGVHQTVLVVVGRRMELVAIASTGNGVDLLLNAEAEFGDVQEGAIGSLEGDCVVEDFELHCIEGECPCGWGKGRDMRRKGAEQ